MPSDVQVFVRFKKQCVFAGEELDCIITFKNIAELPEPSTPGATSFQRSRKDSISQLSNAVAAQARLNPNEKLRNARSPSTGRTERPRANHKGSFSLSMPATPVMRDPSPSNETISSGRPSGHSHQRSVSIISMHPPNLSPGALDPNTSRTKPTGHRRSSTVQISDTQHPGQIHRQSSTDLRVQRPAGRRSPLSVSHSPSSTEPESRSDFKFPPDKSSQLDHSQNPNRQEAIKSQHYRSVSLVSQGTSADVYEGSNHSDETFASEQVSMVSELPGLRARMPSEMMRQHYRMGPTSQRKPQAVTLLMGYVQVSATFTLDTSLVDQTPFEEVKKKGFLGGQAGGGVVGVKKKARPASGLFGSFNFASIGESIESIIGGETSSSVKEMKAVTNSRAIPLLSTPQSLLFVDLHLEPGDERSFRFSYRLPRGLPASHRGKAIKIVYNLVIGVQGAPGSQQQVSDVRQVNIPFRMFPGVDMDGEILGHDLMQPHVILKDLAKVSAVENAEIESTLKNTTTAEIDTLNMKFLTFVDNLLDRNRRRQSSSSLLMENFNPQGSKAGNHQSETLRTINQTIMMSNQVAASSDTSTSPNRFEIASGGKRIAVVTLDRPLHRLGETLIVVVDFSNNERICSSLRATLETCEKVVPSLAVRSAATISRVSRKIYASRAENVIFQRRAVFCPSIPVLVSPTFLTSGVSLDWLVRLEFRIVKEPGKDGDEDEVREVTREASADVVVKQAVLLEELVNDERGIVEVAVESLECDTFEVAIPLTVYGDVVDDGTVDMNDVAGVPI